MGALRPHLRPASTRPHQAAHRTKHWQGMDGSVEASSEAGLNTASHRTKRQTSSTMSMQERCADVKGPGREGGKRGRGKGQEKGKRRRGAEEGEREKERENERERESEEEEGRGRQEEMSRSLLMCMRIVLLRRHQNVPIGQADA